MTLTQRDLDEIETLMRQVIKDETKHLPPKHELYERLDKIMGELLKTRQEQEILRQRTSETKDRLEKLEEIHPRYQHLSA